MSISGNVIQTWNSSGRNIVTIGRHDGTSVAAMGSFLDNQPQFNALGVASMTLGVDEDAGRFQRIRSTISGSALSASGTNFKLLTCVSGDAVNISGQTVQTSISGNFVNTSMSGNIVTIMYGSTLKTSAEVVVGSESGGTPLAVGAGLTANGIKIKNIGNIGGNVVHIGSVTNPPSATVGFPLLDSEHITDLFTGNPNDIRLWTANSGSARIAWMGFDL